MKTKLQTDVYALGISIEQIRARLAERYGDRVSRGTVTKAISGAAKSELSRRIAGVAQDLVWEVQANAGQH